MTYADYLCVPDLLALQRPKSQGTDHDEWLFITIHQVYELWFKQLLLEADRVAAQLRTGNAVTALGGLKRVLTILKTLVSQVDILETMTPLSFASFRDLLGASSGFQSAQFREVEALLGIRDAKKIALLPQQEPGTQRVLARMQQPSLYDALLAYLVQKNYAIPADVLQRDVAQELPANPDIQTLLIQIYRADAEGRELCERFVDLDEGIQEWRYRHVKMVERTIGVKMGTGGSPGVAYLLSTILKPCFPDLWAIRSEF